VEENKELKGVASEATLSVCSADPPRYQGLWPYCPYASSDRPCTV